MVIPAFGIVSHVVSQFSGKPIFGQDQDGPYTLKLSSVVFETDYMRERKTINICSNLFITIIVVIIYVLLTSVISEFPNPQETNALIISSKMSNYNQLLLVILPGYLVYRKGKFGMSVGSSETIRMFSTNTKLCYGSLSESTLKALQKNKDLKIRQWIAGLIDGDGYFFVNRNKYVSLEIVMESRDIACLNKIKDRYSGSIKVMSHARAVRYRLHHYAGIMQIIKDLNGLLYNPVRIVQFKRICDIYNIAYIPSQSLTYDNGYLSGLIDSDGSIYLNLLSQQIFITISQKSPILLEIIAKVYGGKIYGKDKSWKWILSRKAEILSLTSGYFHKNTCVSAKNKRILMINEFYHLSSIGAMSQPIDSPLGKAVISFKESWDLLF
jgi:hypothetical protein